VSPVTVPVRGRVVSSYPGGRVRLWFEGEPGVAPSRRVAQPAAPQLRTYGEDQRPQSEEDV
jgi:hypothetical protein